MGIAQSIHSSESSTNSSTQDLIIAQPPLINNNLHGPVKFTTDQLRAYNRVFYLGAEKCRRMVSYYLTQARLNGKSEFIKTLYTSCIAGCIPPEYHSPELNQKWMYQTLAMIRSEFPDCQVDVISSGQEYLTIRFQSGI
jgi:hypothetical protein